MFLFASWQFHSSLEVWTICLASLPSLRMGNLMPPQRPSEGLWFIGRANTATDSPGWVGRGHL